MMHEPGELSAASPDRLLEGIEAKLGQKRRRALPADDHAGVHVDDERHIAKARPSRDIGQVRHPEPVRLRSPEVAVDEIGRTFGLGIRDRRTLLRSPDDACEPEVPHEAPDMVTADVDVVADKGLPELSHSVDRAVALMDLDELGGQL
jgi:hypothetical protein